MEIPDGRVELPEIFHYYGIIIISIIILFLTVLWNFLKTAKRYADLPSCYKPVLEAPYQYLTNKMKMKPLPFTALIFQKLIALSKQLEKEGMFHIWCFRHILVIFGEEAVKGTKVTMERNLVCLCDKIFATVEASAEKSADYEILKEGYGEGLIALNVESWKKERKLLNPIFSIENLKSQIPIFNENAKIMIKKLENFAGKPVVDLLPFLEYCVFHNICESIFDVSMKDKLNEMEIEKLFELITGLEQYMSQRWVFPPVVAKLLRFFTPPGWKSMKMYQEAKQYALKVISSAIESISQKSRDSKKDLDLNRRSIVRTLLQHRLKDPSVPPPQLVDESITFLAAGSDTVSITMMWCLYMLGLHKDVQKEAYEEIQSVADEIITYENLCQLEYLDCIIKETLRLYPTVPIFARHLKKDLQYGKHTVPKDTTILFFVYGLHRNQEIYPDPEHFDPDRFRSTNAEKRRWAHIPFSEGYRSCIGKKFAVMEMKVTLAYILRNYEITSLDRREDLDLKWNVVLLPTKRLRMRITRR